MNIQQQHFTKALPSPSPRVTPEMGERLCRMASQHHLSDYNRYKRGVHPNQLQQQQHQQQTQPNNKQHRHHHHHHHHHNPPPQIQANQPPSNHPPQPITHSIGPDPWRGLNHPIPVGAPQPARPNGNTPIQPQSSGLPISPPLDPTLTSSPQQHQPHTNHGQQVSNGAQNPAAPTPKVHSIKTSQSHPMNISPVIPPELAPALRFMLESNNNQSSATKLPIDLFDLTGSESARATELFWQHYQQRKLNQQGVNPSHPQQQGNQSMENLSESSLEQDRKMGNLLLSSCPGKKVRMNETPAQRQATGNHRSPICRDLKSDLTRVYSIGIRAIICCLDDQELEYLGSPWIEYHRIAVECGLKVIRIPIAEGFAPQRGIKEINEVLDEVISSYTSEGIDVLCHCRGGVGRAGLVACCWMLKIGLINKPIFISDSNGLVSYDHHHFGPENQQDQYQFQHLRHHHQQLPHQLHHQHHHHHHLDHPTEVHDMLSFIDGHQLIPKNSVLGQVEKVIEVIRRRRSAKAIETPQQVHFIIQYANWLDTLSPDQRLVDNLSLVHHHSLNSPIIPPYP